ncbi:hypothetical protein BaRGS_00025793 [Batillaria attramentaria]|uniref:Uncharacterized protein n=1 Tax=Batillaria attramentaria TaxID=370345 RepID=A0ABD0K7R1_9CAEN
MSDERSSDSSASPLDVYLSTRLRSSSFKGERTFQTAFIPALFKYFVCIQEKGRKDFHSQLLSGGASLSFDCRFSLASGCFSTMNWCWSGISLQF